MMMQQTPFHAYYTARKLANYVDDNSLIPAFASSNIEIYPYQIAAAEFALRSPYLKGCILCDEGSLGKTYEALLIATQKWYEGKDRQLIILPTNLINQWSSKIENSFSLPYIVLNNETFDTELENPFEQDTLVITTYDFAVSKAEYIEKIKWDLVIFDEADCLNKSNTGENKTSICLKRATENSFKLLLTPTPITMSIMDIYGLIYFIDETVLPDSDDFYKRYFRKPENYAELTNWVSKYAFRTLKSQVTDYVNFSSRVPYASNYELTIEEKELYLHLDKYLALPHKATYPKMDRYELTLMFYHTLSSSAQAFVKTLDGAISRLEVSAEKDILEHIRELAKAIDRNGKTKELLMLLKKCFAHLKSLKINQKVIIFTDNRTTQEYLYNTLEKEYKTLTYSGNNSRDYSIMEQFRNDKNIKILIATDEAAKGLDIEFCPIVINYDLLYNAIELEQRISRCHRQGQKSDVLVVNLLGKDNFSDVRIMELIKKRVLQFDGIFGMSDVILGNFDMPIEDVLNNMRHTDEIEEAFENNLKHHEQENRQLVSHTEDTLFTTFTKAVADKVTVTPKYISDKIDEINNDLWKVVKWYFANRNEYYINEQAKTITLKDVVSPPHLFYYWTGSRNNPYTGLKSYGMDKNHKPHSGRISLTSALVKGIVNEISCADEGAIIVDGNVEPCTIGFYSAGIRSKNSEAMECEIFIGMTESGKVLNDDECRTIMDSLVANYSETGNRTAYWLRNSTGSAKSHAIDQYVPKDEMIQKYTDSKSSAQSEEIDRIKLRSANAKSALEHSLDDMKLQVKSTKQELEAETGDRLKELTIGKQLKTLEQELRKKEENLFFEQMRLDVDLEAQIAEFLNNTKLTVNVRRQFLLKIDCQ